MSEVITIAPSTALLAINLCLAIVALAVLRHPWQRGIAAGCMVAQAACIAALIALVGF